MLLKQFFISLMLIFCFQSSSFAVEEIQAKNIKVQFDKKNNVLANYVLNISDKVRESVSTKTGIKYDQTILIQIAKDTDEFNKITGIDNLAIQGIAISELNLTVINAKNVFQKSNDDIFKLLEHEFAHIYMGNVISHKSDITFPRWFNEGVAQWISDGTNELFSASFQDSLQLAFLNNKVLSFYQIIDGFPVTQDNFTLAYAQSLSMIEYLDENYGNDKLKELIKQLEIDKNFYTAFPKVYNISFNDLEKKWKEDKKESNYTFDYYFSTHFDIFISGLIILSAMLAFIFNFLKNRKIKKQYNLVDENVDF